MRFLVLGADLAFVGLRPCSLGLWRGRLGDGLLVGGEVVCRLLFGLRGLRGGGLGHVGEGSWGIW